MEECPLHTNTVQLYISTQRQYYWHCEWLYSRCTSLAMSTAPAWDINVNNAELWHIFKTSRTQLYEQCVVLLWLAAAYLVVYLHLTCLAAQIHNSVCVLDQLNWKRLQSPHSYCLFPNQYSWLHSALTFYIPTSTFTTFHIAMAFQHNMNISLYKTNCPNTNTHLQKYFTVHCHSICANMASNFTP